MKLYLGINAGIAVANLQQIPLTERNQANSVLFCTGHTANYDFDQWNALATILKTGTTLVMYMSLKTLRPAYANLKPAYVNFLFTIQGSKIQYSLIIHYSTLRKIVH